MHHLITSIGHLPVIEKPIAHATGAIVSGAIQENWHGSRSSRMAASCSYLLCTAFLKDNKMKCNLEQSEIST